MRKEIIKNKRCSNALDGIILVNKPGGVTSNFVVQDVKKMFSLTKVGHCGTLDPIAQGLLILCLGKATKISQFISSLNKEYRAVIQLGEERNTDDEEGYQTFTSDTRVSKKDVLDVLKDFIGEIDQVPPQFSAIKMKGERAYKLAREGQVVHLSSRKVKIYDLILEKFDDHRLLLKVSCSKGTYIRSLARDIGRSLGTYGYLKELERLRIGNFNLGELRTIKNYYNLTLDELKLKLFNFSEALYFIPSIKVADELVRRIHNGFKLCNHSGLKHKIEESVKSLYYKIEDKNHQLIAIVDDKLNYLNVFHYENI